MKNSRTPRSRKLSLARQTLRTLGDRQLGAAAGGTYKWTLTYGFCCPPAPTAKCTLYPCFTDQCTQYCP